MHPFISLEAKLSEKNLMYGRECAAFADDVGYTTFFSEGLVQDFVLV